MFSIVRCLVLLIFAILCVLMAEGMTVVVIVMLPLMNVISPPPMATHPKVLGLTLDP